jgi:hypothetical protein
MIEVVAILGVGLGLVLLVVASRAMKKADRRGGKDGDGGPILAFDSCDAGDGGGD